jgi:hypothetical protein
MSFFAGIVALKDKDQVPSATCDEIRNVLSRDPADRTIEYSSASAFVAKVDLGALEGNGWYVDEAGRVSVLAGEALPGHGAAAGNRNEALAAMHGALVAGDFDVLGRCRGTYCAAHVDPAARSVLLVCDKLGVRPVYYWMDSRFAVFATSLRVIEGLSLVPKRMELQGAVEVACFGYPLGRRTGWSDIFTVMAGEVVQLVPAGTVRRQYWQWGALRQETAAPAEIARECYRRFSDAVELRLSKATTPVSFLSGGLDSRAIVTVLRQKGLTVDTVNFAQERTQDRVYGDLYARAIGSRHHELVKEDRLDVYNKAMLRSWLRDRPGRGGGAPVWSGDGGSVGVGHVYLTQTAVDLAQAGRMREAVLEVLRIGGWSIARRTLNPRIADEVRQMPLEGALEDMAQIDCADPGRALHLFLMRNDQRRHLAGHFENLDLERIEFAVPFFDADFLEPILNAPIKGFLRHEFYMEWLREFPPVATSVPWQAYPGHVPCPLPGPGNLEYQWKGEYTGKAAQRELCRATAARASRLMASANYPAELFHGSILRPVVWMHRLGYDRHSYLLRPLIAMERFILLGARTTGAGS